MTTTACLIIIGNEILSGRTQDKNLAHIAIELNKVGVRLMETRVIPDVEATIIATVNACRTQFDYVFTTGGIGPTHDDITSAAIAKAFGVALTRHPEAAAMLHAHYSKSLPPQAGGDEGGNASISLSAEDASRAPSPNPSRLREGDILNKARLKMADIPEGATLIPNAVSGAPGFCMNNVYVLAGVPAIMQFMLKSVLPQLKGTASLHSVSLTTTIPEGTVAAGLTSIQQRYSDVEIGSYPKFEQGELSTTLVFTSTNTSRNQAALKEAEALIEQLGG